MIPHRQEGTLQKDEIKLTLGRTRLIEFYGTERSTEDIDCSSLCKKVEFAGNIFHFGPLLLSNGLTSGTKWHSVEITFLRNGRIPDVFTSTIPESSGLVAIIISIKINWPMFPNRLALLYITSATEALWRYYKSLSCEKGNQSLFFKSIKMRTALVVCWSISRLPDWSFQSRLVIGFVDYVCFRLIRS